jgi:uncharacterized protein YndB with AHSA1/START domain
MRVTCTAEFAEQPREVFRKLTNEDFLRRYAEASGAVAAEVRVEAIDGTIRTEIDRGMPTDQLPGFLRRFVGRSVEVTEVTYWRTAETDGARHCRVEANVSNLPVRFSGTGRLAPQADGSIVELDGEVTARLPFVGGKAEQLMADALCGALRQQSLVANGT